MYKYKVNISSLVIKKLPQCSDTEKFGRNFDTVTEPITIYLSTIQFNGRIVCIIQII